jgi:hypothetical protein
MGRPHHIRPKPVAAMVVQGARIAPRPPGRRRQLPTSRDPVLGVNSPSLPGKSANFRANESCLVYRDKLNALMEQPRRRR